MKDDKGHGSSRNKVCNAADVAPPLHPGVERRRALVAGTAVAAAVVGLSAGWWRSRTGSAAGGGAVKGAAAEPVPGFWAWQADRPDGTKFSMESLHRGPLLVNFWATWCGPCVQELPLINDFYLKNSPNGWQVLGIAVDRMPPVQAFLAHAPLAFPVAVAGFSGLDFARSLGNISGSLPFSVALDRAGAVVLRKLGVLDVPEFDLLSGLK